ncbi:MAG: CehA/McbA family metallohydrolase [Actinobacteria bacterium]|nr:CehA/McbA family metallohydrolase [Actinomycetota bacterium]
MRRPLTLLTVLALGAASLGATLPGTTRSELAVPGTSARPFGPAAPAPPADPADGEWIAGDLHVHTHHSHDVWSGPDDDNTGTDEFYTYGWSVEEQFRIASTRGLDYLAITDHNDVRSHTSPGFGAYGVTPVRSYEKSLSGHAQMHGATEVYDKDRDGDGDTDADDVNAIADALREADGVFQINHPVDSATHDLADFDWGYGHDVVPDTIEVWNIPWPYQPPLPSGSNNDTALRFYNDFLDAGHHVGATGGSDNHWKATTPGNGVGQPTTWVYVTDRSERGVLEALAAGRTTISHQPPVSKGPRVFIDADTDGDGVWDAMIGDTLPASSTIRIRAEHAAGTLLRVVTDEGAAPFGDVQVDSDDFEQVLTAPEGTTWLRVEVFGEDAPDERATACDDALGGDTTYCRNRLLMAALSSPIYLSGDAPSRDSPVRLVVDGDEVTLTNDVVSRTWAGDGFRTTAMTDLRTDLTVSNSHEFHLDVAGRREALNLALDVTDVRSTQVAGGGLAVTFDLALSGVPAAQRTYTLYPGIAGYQIDTTVLLPGRYTGYTLEVADGLEGAAVAAHHFNAGYDWRGSDDVFEWAPAVEPFGGSHAGQDHRHTTTGETLDVTAQWLSIDSDGDLATGDDPRWFAVLQRVNYDSSRAAFDGAQARVHVDLGDDLAYLGPFESDVHVDNPTPAEMRTRVVRPGAPLELERVFSGFGADADDEPWQHHRYLTEHAWSGWKVGDVVFNSNGVDSNRISTGAKDDMDLDETVRQAQLAGRIGIETFVLDDGWQAASGDWCPDSPDCPEPRADTTGWPPRFPDSEFTAVRDVLADNGGMRLGLWFTPMQFNPAAQAYRDNPTWACTPVGDGLAVYNTVEPDSSSNEAGLGTWNPRGLGPDGVLIDHIESRIRRAIDLYGARYFKFDFLAWVDCLGADGVDAYEYREEFVAMVDRLIVSYPDVTFQIDETNDYRLFPFESAARGPSWYANGGPRPNEALHNLWVLAPYVPGSTIGQGAMSRTGQGWSADYLAATMLGSHVTFFRDLTRFTEDELDVAAAWVERYKTHRDRFTSLTYPLLDDPLPGDTWTGLQFWDAASQRGAVAVYRQDAEGATRSVALRGVRGDGAFTLTDLVTGEVLGTFGTEQLRGGIDVTLPERNSAAVYLIDPA